MSLYKNRILKILIVDDSIAVIKYLMALLSGNSIDEFKVESSKSLEDALRVVNTIALDVVLLDLNLKDSTGLDTLKKMRANNSQIPIIVITGAYKDDIGINAVTLGAQDFLKKDKLDYYSVKKAVYYAIERKRIEDELKESEAKWRSLIENTSDIIMNINRDAEILFINRTVFGLTIQDVIGVDVYKFIPMEYHDLARKSISKVFKEGDSANYESEAIGPNNTVLWYSVRISPIIQEEEVVAANMTITDITSRRQTENALRDSEAKFRSITQTVHDAIIMMDEDGRISFWNIAAENIFGYSQEEALSKDLHGLLAPERSYSDFRKAISKFKNTGQGAVIGKRLEMYGVRKGGDEFPLELSLSAVKIKDKWNAVGIIRDITKRKQADLDLKESEERYRVLFESSVDGILIIDIENNKYKYANPAICKMLGYKENKILKMDIDDIYPQENISYVRSEFTAIAKSKKGIAENIPCLRKDGVIIFADITATRVKINGERCAIRLYRDITDRKQKDEQLSLFQSLAETSGQGFGWADFEGIIRYANPSLCRMLGEEHPENCNGKQLIKYYDSDTYAMLVEKIFPMVLTKGFWEGEIMLNSIDGKRIPTLNNLFALNDSDGNPIYFAIVVTDITERKNAIEERFNLEKQLQQSKKMESLGTLASGIAHEINTPIQYIGDNIMFFSEGVINLFELLNKLQDIISICEKTGVTDGLVEKVNKALKDTDIEYLINEIPPAISQSFDGIDRVKKIINAMKFFSHFDGDEKAIADINKAVDSAVMISKNEWKYVAEVTANLDPELPKISCFIGEINQAIMNLIINASHAISDVLEKSGNEKGSITISTQKKNGSILIIVKDSGSGIPEEIRDRIFDHFFTTKDVGKGTGQGLSLVYDVIVNKHNGRVAVDSEIGKGSAFILQLPI